MATLSKPQEPMVRPFVNKIVRKPIQPGNRITKGEWTKLLENMGFNDWVGFENESERRKTEFLNHVKWDIAHRNYSVLKSCISIDESYDEKTQLLSYTIDLYGDRNVYKCGHIHIHRGDFLLFYMRMAKNKRKEALISRIALANVGMLVPYIEIDKLSYDSPPTKVRAMYRIVL